MDHQQMQLEAMRALTAQLPLNDFGLPIGIYRADLLPFHDYVAPNAPPVSGILPSTPGAPTPPVTHPPATHNPAQNVLRLTDPDYTPTEEELEAIEVEEPTQSQSSTLSQEEVETEASKNATRSSEGLQNSLTAERRICGFPQRALERAYVYLQYDEGYPTFDDGRAFWHQMVYEPYEAYQAFQRYLQMPAGRPGDADSTEDYGRAASGTRSLSQLAALMCPQDYELLAFQEQLKVYYHLYYWGLRTHAYDMFRIAAHRKQQEIRAIETRDEHYIAARKLRHRVMQYMEDEEDFWDMMSPKVAVDLLKQVTQLERISADMPALNPQLKDEAPSQSFEVAFRTAAQNNAKSVVRTDDGSEVLTSALSDPEATETLQELIIRFNGGVGGNNHSGQS